METSASASRRTRGLDRTGRSPDRIMRRPQADLREKCEPRGSCAGRRSIERSIDPRAPNREEVSRTFAHAFEPFACMRSPIKICVSGVGSETARRSRSFSFSSCLRRRSRSPLISTSLATGGPSIGEIRDLADPHLPDRIRHGHALPTQNLCLPYLADDLLRLVPLPRSFGLPRSET